MQQTENYKLNKIELADSPPDITVLNSNWDEIDAELKSASDVAENAQKTADGKAPISHASSENTYGLGTSGNYGHVKLSDAVDSTSNTASGVAATPRAVKSAYDKAVEAKGTADDKLPLSGGNVTGNLTVQNKNVVRTINGAVADDRGEITIGDYVISMSVSDGEITYNKKNGTKGVTTITKLPVANGGTGANNATDALANLGIDDAITGLSVSDGTITYTRKNGTSGAIQTQIYNDTTLRYLIDENKFLNYSLGRAFNYGLLLLCVEVFDDTADVDTSIGAGTAIADYYDAANHLITKTGVGYIVLQSLPQTCTKNNADVWAYVDWEGTGSVKIEVSRDSGTTFTEVVFDSLTSISTQPSGTAMVCRLTLTGEVVLKNVAWGCK